ncbi:hypothetical protein Hdeb2414_s0019g00543061 [Helianthus debilis subsp. tardiflorus]
MFIEPTVNRFRVLYQMHCSQGFYSFAQRALAKKILLHPPKSFHEWKPKFFFIKADMIPMKMTFRGKEDTVVETIQTPYSKTWYQDLKDIPSVELPEKALVAAGMRLYWRMEREDKPVGRIGRWPPSPREPDEELWYLQIVKNFVLPRDEDLVAQPSTVAGELTNLGIGPKKKKQRTSAAVNTAPKKTNESKAQTSKAKNVNGEKKGTRHSSDSWCDYVVVSDVLEGLAPLVVMRPKAEPRDSVDILVSNPDDPIDLESSPEPLVKMKAGKRKLVEVEAEAQPAKKV